MCQRYNSSMYAASQITATAIVPYPKDDPTAWDHAKPGKVTQPYILLHTNDAGMTTQLNPDNDSVFVGVTISETDVTSKNKALTVQLSGMTTVRLEKEKQYSYGDILYGAANGCATSVYTARRPVVGRFLSDFGEQEGYRFGAMLMCRSAVKRKSLADGMVYASPFNVTQAGDVILRNGKEPNSNHETTTQTYAGISNLCNYTNLAP